MSRESRARPGLCRTVEPSVNVSIGSTEQDTGLADPGKGGELVDSGDEECRQTAVERLVNGNYRQRTIAGEVALEIRASDSQFARSVIVWKQRERIGLKPRPTPRT